MSHAPPRSLLLCLALSSAAACGGPGGGSADAPTDTSNDAPADATADSPPDAADAVADEGSSAADAPGEGSDAAGDAEADAPPENPGPGPGLGNVTFGAAELFNPIAWIDQTTGVPPGDPDFLQTFIKPYGTNVAYMFNGYLTMVFAADSGGPPGGLLFYDVSDPHAPRLVHRHYDPHATTGAFREAHSIGFSYVGGRALAVLHSAYGVEFWDLTNVLDPQRLSSLALPGVDAGDYENVAWQLFWQGNTVYVATSSRGLFVVDAADPAAPVLADRGEGRPNPIPPSELGGFRIGPVFAVGNVLVVSSMDTNGGFATLDASDPYNPTLLASRTRDLPGYYSLCVSNDLLVTASRGGQARMGVYSFADPFRLPTVHDRVVIDHMLYCAGQDDFIFQGAEHEFVKVDATTFEIVGRGHLERTNVDHGQISMLGNMMFVGNDHGTGSALVPHQAAPDTTPPEARFIHPLDGDQMVAVRSRVGVVFSDTVLVETLTPETFSVRPRGGAALAGRYTGMGAIVNFEPDQPLEPDTTYEVVIAAGGVHDCAGNAVAETTLTSFTTASVGADGAGAPRVSLAAVPPAGTDDAIDFVAAGDDEVPQQYSWSFGDGSAWTALDAASTATHAYEAPGHYTVAVRATNGRGWASATTRVTISDAPAIDLATRSGTIAVDRERRTVWTANIDSGTVTAFSEDTRAVLREVAVGAHPGSLAVGPDGAVWVAVRDEDALVRVDAATGDVLERHVLPWGSRPVAVAADPRGRFVAVALDGTSALALFRTLDDAPALVPLEGRLGGIAVAASGETLVVTRFLSDALEGGSWSLQLDEAGAPAAEPVWVAEPVDTRTADAEDRARGVPNMLGAPVWRPGTPDLWVPATLANVARGPVRDGQALTFESAVRAIALRRPAGGDAHERLDFNNRALPRAIAFTPLGDWAFVVLQASNLVHIVDAFTGATVGVLGGPGAAPQDIALSADGRTAYVHAFLDRHVAAYDLGGLIDGVTLDPPRVATIATEAVEPLPRAVLAGKRVFYDASDPRMSRDGYIACATCHLDGAHDGVTWDFTDRGEGLRNTIDLRGRAGMGHGPVHWTANFDEIQDFENDIRNAFGGRGFLEGADWRRGTTSDPLGDPKVGLSSDLDALAAYVATLDQFPRSPFRAPDGEYTGDALAGAAVFDALGCASCHAGSAYTDSALDAPVRHDVGSIRPTSGQRRGGALDGFDTPTLAGVWATGPYLHDGSAPALDDVFDGAPEDAGHGIAPLAPEARARLIRYLLEL